MVTVRWEYARAELAELCAKLALEGVTAQELRTVITTKAIALTVDQHGSDRAADVFRCIANSIEYDAAMNASEGEQAARPSLTVIEGGGGSKV